LGRAGRDPRPRRPHPRDARRSPRRRRPARGRHRAEHRPDDGRDRLIHPMRLPRVPGWIEPAILPALNLALALALSALVVLMLGENPQRALRLLVAGAFGTAEVFGYTLYYATNFVFTGLAVALAFHGGLFNIGADGQAYLGGLAVALLCLGAERWPTALVI